MLIFLMCASRPTNLTLLICAPFQKTLGDDPHYPVTSFSLMSKYSPQHPLPSCNYFLSSRCETNSCFSKIS
jgi:hypothetical protein